MSSSAWSSVPSLNLRGVNVLVVEDDAASRELLCRIVASFGARVSSARNGLEGLDRAHAQKPDLILCDLLMPELDGFGLMRRLRANPELCRVAVIAVSALGTEADFWRTWEAGFSGHLVKPVDVDVIAAQLARVFWAHPIAERKATLGLARR